MDNFGGLQKVVPKKDGQYMHSYSLPPILPSQIVNIHFPVHPLLPQSLPILLPEIIGPFEKGGKNGLIFPPPKFTCFGGDLDIFWSQKCGSKKAKGSNYFEF